MRPGERVLEIGAGRGVITFALARRSARVIAVEQDPHWSRQLRHLRQRAQAQRQISIVEVDFFTLPFPARPFRVMGSVPFARTTDILRRLLDDPDSSLTRADLIVQWEVAQKRAVVPPTTLLSTIWAPWWDFSLGARIPAAKFKPAPRVDAGILTITRRAPPLLPQFMSGPYARFVRENWPFKNARGN